MDWACDSVSSEAVSRPDLHEALGRGEGEDHGVSGVSSEARGGYSEENGNVSRLLTTRVLDYRLWERQKCEDVFIIT